MRSWRTALKEHNFYVFAAMYTAASISMGLQHATIGVDVGGDVISGLGMAWS